MKVSILIQNRNYGRFLERCIESALSIDFPEDQYEIIGMDANSTDNSMEIYNKYKDKITVVEAGDRNQAEALNYAIEKYAKGKYLAWINADDRYLPNFIKVHIVGLENPDVSLTHSRAYLETPEGKRSIAYDSNHPADELKKWNYIFQPATMFKREHYDKIGGFSEKTICSFDYHFWFELAKIGKFIYIPDFTIIYSSRSDSMSNVKKSEETIEANLIRERYKDVVFV